MQGLDLSWFHVVQKTSMIELAGPLVAMDWDLQSSLVSQAATQVTLAAGDWKLAKEKTNKNKNKNKQVFKNISVVQKEI